MTTDPDPKASQPDLLDLKPDERFTEDEAAALTADEFAKLSYRRRVALHVEHPDTYHALALKEAANA